MTVTIPWEPVAAGGPDGYGEWTYGPAQNLRCWIEPHSGGQSFGETAIRRSDETVVEPIIDVYFDGDDPLARTIKLWDRFTPGVIASEGKALQAKHVETLYGPPFDNRRPWLIIVML